MYRYFFFFTKLIFEIKPMLKICKLQGLGQKKNSGYLNFQLSKYITKSTFSIVKLILSKC